MEQRKDVNVFTQSRIVDKRCAIMIVVISFEILSNAVGTYREVNQDRIDELTLAFILYIYLIASSSSPHLLARRTLTQRRARSCAKGTGKMCC